MDDKEREFIYIYIYRVKVNIDNKERDNGDRKNRREYRTEYPIKN
jgi:hypothetical protein